MMARGFLVAVGVCLLAVAAVKILSHSRTDGSKLDLIPTLLSHLGLTIPDEPEPQLVPDDTYERLMAGSQTRLYRDEIPAAPGRLRAALETLPAVDAEGRPTQAVKAAAEQLIQVLEDLLAGLEVEDIKGLGPTAGDSQVLASQGQVRALLEGLPHVWWINTAQAQQRREQMEQLFVRMGIGHSRVEAINGRDPQSWRGKIQFPQEYTGPTLGMAITASHFKAMQACLEDESTQGDPYCFVAEDDLSLDYVPFWAKPFGAYLQGLPADFELAQLTVFVCPNHTNQGVDVPLGPEGWAPMPRPDSDIKWFSCAAYLIHKDTARGFLGVYVRPDGVFDFSGGNVESDHLLYKGRRVYSLPLLTYVGRDTQVHPGMEHLRMHVVSKEYLRYVWLKHHIENLASGVVAKNNQG